MSAVFPLPDNAAPLRLPCAGGGGRRTPLGGVVGAAKRGTYIYFCLCRQPLSHGKAATAPLTQGSREADSHGRKYAFSYAHRSRLPGCTGEPWAILTRGGTRIHAHPVCTFAEKAIIFFVCGARLSGARRKGCAPLASPVQGEVGGGRRSEGLLRAAKRGHANIFYACRQPLSQPDG